MVERPPDLTARHFEPPDSIQQMSSVYEELMALRQSSPAQACLLLQKYLLSGLTDSRVGLYSRFHDIAVYEKGYANYYAIRMAYM